MSRMRRFLAPFFLVSIAQAAVVQRAVPQPSENSCELAVKLNRQTDARIKFAGAGDRVSSAALEAGANTGVAAIELLKATANVTVSAGKVADSVLNDSRWLPEIRTQLLESLPSLWLNVPVACSDPSIVSIKEMLEADPQVESVRRRSPDPQIAQEPLPAKRPAPNDPDFIYQYYKNCTGQIVQFGAEGSATCDPSADTRFLVGPLPTGGHRVRVIITDTGIDLTHPDFPVAKINMKWSINVFGKTEEEKANIQDDNGHGTHVAGTYSMFANNGKFGAGSADSIDEHIILKAFDKSGTSKEEVVITAMYWIKNVVETAKKESRNFVEISQNSWTAFGDFAAFRKVLLELLNAGVTFVAAAGNASQNNDKEYDNVNQYDILPQSYANKPEFFRKPLVIVVATDSKNQLASFSNYGWQTTHTAAPGTYVYSIVPQETPLGSSLRAKALSGTSMSAPQVTEGLALLYKKEGRSAVGNIQWRVRASSDPFPQFYRKVPGRLNMYELWRADDRLPEQITDAKIVEVSYNSAKLVFTVPKDSAGDGSPRRLGAYFFRTSLRQITEQNFAFAKPQFVLPPQEAGRKEEIALENLTPDTENYAAFYVVDKGGNASFYSLPPFRTKPVHTTFIQFTGNFDPARWTTEPIEKLESLWHVDGQGNWVYRVKDQPNYNTGKDNGGILWTSWQTVPQDARLVVYNSRNTGYFYSEVYQGTTKFFGDPLFVVVQRESGKIEEIAKLDGNGGLFEISVFPLNKFAGEVVKIGFKFKATQEFAQASRGGVVIYFVEIYGTRQDLSSLPPVPNGDFELSGPSRLKGAPAWARDLANWKVDYICYPQCLSGTKDPDQNPTEPVWSEDWFVSRANDDSVRRPSHPPINPPHKPHNPPPTLPSVMKMWNATRDEGAISAVTSDPVPVKTGDLYEVNFRAKISFKLTVLITALDKNKRAYVVGFSELKNPGGWQWLDYSVPFMATGTKSVQAVFLLSGSKTGNVAAEIDDVKVNFLKKVFPETDQ